MGFLRWLRGGSAGNDAMRLEIMMDYSGPIRRMGTLGVAAVRWSILALDLPPDFTDLFRAALVTLLYAEALVIHAETRASLLARVDAAVGRWMRSRPTSGPTVTPLAFDDWSLGVAGMAMPLWPWHLMEPKHFQDALQFSSPAVGWPKTYTATLKMGQPTKFAPDGLWSFTDMPPGQERVCVPSAPLIAAYALGLETLTAGQPDAVGCLCLLLHHVNRYYESQGRFPLASYPVALRQGMAALERHAGKQ